MTTLPASAGPRHPKAAWFLQQRLLDAIESFTEVEARITQLPTEQARGDAFEVFAEAYFATQPLRQAVEVWPLQVAPPTLRKQAGIGVARDLGVDGLFRVDSGDLHAFQVKFRTGRAALTWRGDLSTFMGLSDQVAQRVVFTNSDTLPPAMADRQRVYAIRGRDLDGLLPADFGIMRRWLNGAVSTPRPVRTPRPHQDAALADIVASLKTQGSRATAVMACGTGKTLVGFWAAQRLEARRTLVLLPSLTLMSLILHEWLREAPCAYLCVCSDASVKEEPDGVPVRPMDLDFPVTTDHAVVRAFLDRVTDRPYVIFSTYQSARVVGKGLPAGFAFDLGIFDEAHKTAGREGAQFGFALDDHKLRVSSRLFLTATPRHYDVGRRDVQGDPVPVYSMDQPERYGPVVHTLSFARAIEQKLIADYRVVISVVTRDMVNAELLRRGEVVVQGDVIRARQVANQIALEKAIEAHGVQKAITFHRSIETARSFTAPGAEGISAHLPAFTAFHVNGRMATAERTKWLAEFQDTRLAIMSNARCLTEGVDVPAVDLVAFMAPKRSRIDIVQAAGRAMRIAPGKTRGYILVPLFVEQEAGESIEAAAQRTGYDEVLEVLQALQEHDEALADIIRAMREARGRIKGYDDQRFRERVEVLGPEVSLELLRGAITTVCLDRLGVLWDERYGQLVAYKNEHGDCNVPTKWPDNPTLALWVVTQRAGKDHLSADRVGRLDALGFTWDIHGASWETAFQKLKLFKETQGHCNVPHLWPEDRALGFWVAGQRRRRLSQALAMDQIERLDQLGFEWDPYTAEWETNFQKLTDFQRTYNHCRVPSAWPDDRALGRWVNRQRTFQHSGRLSADRFQRLDALGFCWDADAAVWEIMCDRLAAYKERFGDCNVPAVWPKDRDLGQWVRVQRTRRLRRTIRTNQINRLDALGFTWDIHDRAWETKFQQLKQFKQTHGHCNVPRQGGQAPGLGTWVNNLRARKDRLSPEQTQKLDALAFEWEGRDWDVLWDERYGQLVAFKKQFGHCNVPRNWQQNLPLANWVGTQRQWYRKDWLSPDQIQKLTALGLEWKRPASAPPGARSTSPMRGSTRSIGSG